MNHKKISFIKTQQIVSYSTLEADTEEFDIKYLNSKQDIAKYNNLVKDLILLSLDNEEKINQLLNPEVVLPIKQYLSILEQQYQKPIDYEKKISLNLLQFLIEREENLVKLYLFLRQFKYAGLYNLILISNQLNSLIQEFQLNEYIRIVHYIQQFKISHQYEICLLTIRSFQIGIINGFTLYQYPLFPLNDNMFQYKTIIVLGQIGSGKSQMINFFLNYYLGVKFTDNFRYQLIKQTAEKGPEKTEDVNVYYIKPINGNPGLRIIDTPGFGDSRGVEYDKLISNKIMQFIKNYPHTISAICFVAQASVQRFTSKQNYIFNLIKQIFGNDIVKNFVFMLSFCDAGSPKAKQAIQFNGDKNNFKSPFAEFIPQIKEPWCFKFNNSVYLSQNEEDTPGIIMGKLFWDLGIKAFSQLVEKKIKLNLPSDLSLTRQVILEREKISNLIDILKPKILTCKNLIDNHKQVSNILEKINRPGNEGQHFEIEMNKIKIEKQNLNQGEYAMDCTICNTTCHYPCKIIEKEGNCQAMKNQNCTICPRKCHFTLHFQLPYRCKKIQYKEKKQLKELEYLHSQSKSKLSLKDYILQEIENEFLQLQAECLLMEDQLINCLDSLNQIALQPVLCVSQEHYVDNMIQDEMNDQSSGFLERVKALNQLKEDWKFIKEAIENKGEYYKTQRVFFQSISKQSKSPGNPQSIMKIEN